MKPLSSVGLIMLCCLVLGSFAAMTQPHTAAAGIQPDTTLNNEQCMAPLLQQGEAPEIGEGDLILRGAVRSATDKPLAGYIVQLRAMTDVIDQTSTNEEGYFTFGNLPEGAYTFEVRDEDGASVALSPASESTVELEANANMFPVLYVEGVGDEAAVADTPIAPAQTGVISGTVTAEDTSNPLEDVEVTVLSSDGSYVNDTMTDASGNYSITGLDAGDYIVEFDPQNFVTEGDPVAAYLLEYYDNQPDEDTADLVTVSESATTSDIDAALTRGNVISGTVTAEDTSNPLENVEVVIFTSDGSYVSDTETDASGNYTTPGLPSGSYIVAFDPQNFSTEGEPAEAYLPEYYDNQPDRDAADSIAFISTGDTTSVDAALALGSQISGTVTAEDTSDPIAGIDVSIYEYCTFRYVTDTETDASGNYTTPGLPSGSYIVEFEASYFGPSVAYIDEYYDDQATRIMADQIDVTAPTAVNDIDAQLTLGGSIAGTVTAEDTNDPLQYVDVTVRTASGGYVAEDSTDSTGTYEVQGLLSGDYTVEFEPYFTSEDYIPEYYDDQATRGTADTVSVTVGSTTSNIDAALAPGGSISGTITAADTGTPLDDVFVDIYDSNGSYVAFKSVNSLGEYNVRGLTSGDYLVEFSAFGDASQYIDEYYDGQIDRDDADPVTVTVPNATTNINADLDLGGQISGTVTADDTNDPLENVDVTIRPASGGSFAFVDTDENGMYTSGALPTGDYIVEFDAPSFGTAESYLGEYYDDQSSSGDADTVSVTAPNTTSNIDASLAVGGSITGIVTDANTGNPLANIYVQAECEQADGSLEFPSAITNAQGEYELVGLPTSTCIVQFFPPFNRCTTFAGEFYNDQPAEDLATPISVTAPSTTSGIDAALDSGGSISGVVTGDDTGLGLDDVDVNVYDSNGEFIKRDSTDSSGSYLLPNLPVGSYVVEFAPDDDRASAAYFAEFYNDQSSQATADTVTVTANTDTGNIDAVLARGGQISGFITGEDTAAGINADAVVFDSAGNEVADVENNSTTGEYITPGLPSGDYTVEFVPEGSDRSYIREFYNDKATQSEADTVTVTVPNVTENINGVLAPGGSISGTVTDSATNEGIDDVHVYVYDSVGTQVASASTGSSGTYQTTGIPAGTYYVQFVSTGSQDYQSEFYNDKLSLETADPVVVTALSVTSSIDAALDAEFNVYVPFVQP
jgi:hypothetical protein